MDLLISLALFVLGAVLASFFGVVASRLYTGQTIVLGRSRCDSCRHELGAFELVPIVSWLVAWGSCRACGARVSAFHTLSELVLGVLFVLAYRELGLSPELLVFLAALSTLHLTVVYDLRHTIIPQSFSLAFLALSFAYALLVAPTISLFGLALLTAGGIGLFFFLLYAMSGGRAMGLGDAPVALALSLLVAPFALSGFLFSFWIGAVIGIFILVLRSGGPKMGIEVPFAPFLAAGYLLAYFTQWTPFALFG